MNKIFYFTGTGNSKYVGDKIKETFGGTTIDIIDAHKMKLYSYQMVEGDMYFFIFPVYFNNLPLFMETFIANLMITDEHKGQIIGICTHGGMPGGIDRGFYGAMKRRGYSVSGFYAVEMVDNYIVMFKIPRLEEQIMINRKGDKEISDIFDSIKFNHRQTYSSGIIGLLRGPLKAAYNISRKTKRFYATDKCVGCSVCSNICPDMAIEMVDNRPKWTKSKCNFCMACINRCPYKAIEYGKKTIGKERYINSTTKL